MRSGSVGGGGLVLEVDFDSDVSVPSGGAVTWSVDVSVELPDADDEPVVDVADGGTSVVGDVSAVVDDELPIGPGALDSDPALPEPATV